MAPEERRGSILDAALPLVRERGRAVTTKEIALAAGVSEGTVFHVFGDKDALIDALVQREFATGRTRPLLESIDPTLPLDELVTSIVRAVRQRLTDIFTLMVALGLHRPPVPDAVLRGRGRSRADAHHQLLARVTELLRPHASRLRETPERTAETLRLLTFAASHPLITHGSPLEVEEITDLLLHGITTRDDGGPAC